MTITRIEPGPRMSNAVVHNGVVYLSGLVGRDGEDVASQTRAALADVDRLLALAGTDKSHLISATIWLADMADFAAMNTVWDAWVDPANTPARATGESRLAKDKYRVEVMITAALPG